MEEFEVVIEVTKMKEMRMIKNMVVVQAPDANI
jgi:hypothetical protein